MIDNNTVCKTSTHFLRGVELVKQGLKEYSLCSENWAYPTSYRYGFPRDNYYAEIWIDGMDWNLNYWLIESCNLENPKIYPLFHFDEAEERGEYNEHDFSDFCSAVMHYRREKYWIKSSDWKGYYSDAVWPYVNKVDEVERLKECPCMVKYFACHASQKPVYFYFNEDLIS